MSILHRFSNGWLLSHEVFLNDLVGPEYVSKGIFQIQTPYRMDQEAARIAGGTKARSRKRTRKQACSPPEVVRSVIESLRCSSELRDRFQPLPRDLDVIKANNRVVRELVRSLETSNDPESEDIKPHIQENNEIRLIRQGEALIPPGSAYYVGDVANMKEILQGKEPFDVILCDPPWENKHVRRSGTYKSMDNINIFNSIPLDSLLSLNGILLVWCTSTSPRHQSETLEWIESSGLRLLGTLYWLKVTISGELVHEETKNRPSWELLYIASRLNDGRTELEPRVILSVPSAVHSHKPPLIEVLKDLGLPWRNGLEIFGRYLLPGWTTIGNQALKLQHIKYFKDISYTK